MFEPDRPSTRPGRKPRTSSGSASPDDVPELLEPVVPGAGLAALPAPSPGGLFFDIEGDPFAFGHGLEYLLGWVDADGGYTALRALNPESEKAAFERFIERGVEPPTSRTR